MDDLLQKLGLPGGDRAAEGTALREPAQPAPGAAVPAGAELSAGFGLARA